MNKEMQVRFRKGREKITQKKKTYQGGISDKPCSKLQVLNRWMGFFLSERNQSSRSKIFFLEDFTSQSNPES